MIDETKNRARVLFGDVDAEIDGDGYGEEIC